MVDVELATVGALGEVVLLVARLTNLGGLVVMGTTAVAAVAGRWAAVRAEGRVDGRDQLITGQEHDLPKRQRAGLGLTQRLLQQLHANRSRRLPRVVDHDPVRVKAEIDKVAVELLDVGAIAIGARSGRGTPGFSRPSTPPACRPRPAMPDRA